MSTTRILGPIRRITTVTLVAAVTLAGPSIINFTPAGAVTGYHVVVGSLGLNARIGPGTAYSVVGHLVNGQEIDIACQTKGDLIGVGLPGTPTDVWDYLTNGWFITDYYTSTTGVGGNYTPGIPQCGGAPAPVPAPPPPPKPIYNRAAAAAWALANYNKNPNHSFYYYIGRDCTNFVSQALWAGGIPRTPDWTDNPNITVAAKSADFFKNYVVNNGIATIREVSWSDNSVGGAQEGDIIGYDWDGAPDGILDHLAIISDAPSDPNFPSVSQHSPNRQSRYWSWDPGTNTWIQDPKSHPGSRVYLIHIIK